MINIGRLKPLKSNFPIMIAEKAISKFTKNKMLSFFHDSNYIMKNVS